MTIEIPVSKLKKVAIPHSNAASSLANPHVPTGNTYSSLFDSLLLECIDEVLTVILGTGSREAVYDNLERTQFLARNEIPKHLDLFIQFLKEMLGSGSRVVGKAIAKKLYSKLGLEFVETPSFEFGDYLQRVRRGLTELEGTDQILENNRQAFDE